MLLSNSKTKQLGEAVDVAKMLGIEAVMLSEGKIRGVKSTMDAAIIADLELDIPHAIQIGVGRVNEFSNRASQFESCEAELKVNERNEATSVIFKTKNAKMEFRCAAASMIRFPKSIDDETGTIITITPDEAKLLNRAISSMGSEHVVIQLTRNGNIRFEIVDDVKDCFELVLENNADIQNEDVESFVFTYLSKLFTKILTSKNNENIEMRIGVGGSLTVNTKGYDVILFSQLSYDEDGSPF